MDPAPIPISHDRTDFSSKREDAGPVYFEVMEGTDRGFAGIWGLEKDVLVKIEDQDSYAVQTCC